jgi:cytochrome c-type biogenesis protein
LATSFLLGLATPLTAACVLPLYPGFIAFLAGQREGARRAPLTLGLAVVAGVTAAMVAIGLIFSTLLEVSLTGVTAVASPIAFAVLAVIGVLLILNVDFSRLLPVVRAPTASNPVLAAFGYGAFFGFIVLPCNPGFIGAFFSKQLAVSVGDFGVNMLNFVIFAIGIGTPLLVLALASGAFSQAIVRFLGRHKSIINRVAGAAMLAIAAYYLIKVFVVFG